AVSKVPRGTAAQSGSSVNSMVPCPYWLGSVGSSLSYSHSSVQPRRSSVFLKPPPGSSSPCTTRNSNQFWPCPSNRPTFVAGELKYGSPRPLSMNRPPLIVLASLSTRELGAAAVAPDAAAISRKTVGGNSGVVHHR